MLKASSIFCWLIRDYLGLSVVLIEIDHWFSCFNQYHLLRLPMSSRVQNINIHWFRKGDTGCSKLQLTNMYAAHTVLGQSLKIQNRRHLYLPELPGSAWIDHLEVELTNSTLIDVCNLVNLPVTAHCVFDTSVLLSACFSMKSHLFPTSLDWLLLTLSQVKTTQALKKWQ